MSTASSPARDETATASTSGRDRYASDDGAQERQLHSLFDELDADHSGKIEPGELKVRLSLFRQARRSQALASLQHA